MFANETSWICLITSSNLVVVFSGLEEIEMSTLAKMERCHLRVAKKNTCFLLCPDDTPRDGVEQNLQNQWSPIYVSLSLSTKPLLSCWIQREALLEDTRVGFRHCYCVTCRSEY
ncbi:hypothetical protein Bca4012_072610 [Brassica carinata]|uniref:(rape) hypothetical protein n=1 Tax=Brassica napus TaxID=3708 RepID=A0A816LA83_BRANA|nr:hypothetical protein HID58_066749 [Brassica napus]CAF1929690.1 unnamed protein product [Brassica napus]